MSNAEEELLKAFSNIIPVEINEEYRAYYDDENKVRFYMANKFDIDDTKWINISKEEYIAQDYQWMWVENNKLVKKLPSYKYEFPLTRSNNGNRVVKNHAGILLEANEEYPEIEYYTTKKNNA